jgi:flagellin
VLTSAVVAGTTENLIVTTDNTPQSFQVAAGATVADVINTINNAGTGITAALDTSTGKLMLTDTQDNGDIAVTDNASNQLVNNLSGETLGGTTNGFGTPELMTSTNTMSVFLSDSTQTGTSTVNVALNTFNSTNLGVAGQGIANNDLTNTTDAATALTAINTAISNVSALRGNLGSGVNQLQAATNVISSQTQNLTTASSNITSADIGQTVANMTEFSILSQTGMAAMAQADQMQKGILTLLQG